MILLGKCLYEVSFEDWPAGILVNATLWRVDAPLTDTLMLCTRLGHTIGNEEPATSQSVIELADRMQVVEESGWRASSIGGRRTISARCAS